MRYLYQNVLKLFVHPYLFFEEAIEKNDPAPASITFLISWLIASLGWFFVSNNLLGNLRLISGMLIALATYPIVVAILYLLCRILVRETRLSSFFNVWGFSYLPTLIFAIGNILVHFLQKYDWFISAMNNPFIRICLWTFIFLTLLWKGLFLAITLRLAGNLNLIQIIQAMTIISLLVLLYWRGGFLLGWFKVPFI